MTPPFLTAPALKAPGLAHGFFSRVGGVSSGVYATLNTGPGSGDLAANVAENRRRCARALGVEPRKILSNYQIHSANVVVVNAAPDAPARADAFVTNRPGLALGVLAADCMAWLFADLEARVIGAAHAGWRGALAGVLENTVTEMQKRGARAQRIRAALGPCLRQANFEVGLELVDAFAAKHAQANRFFSPGRNAAKRQLDLAGFAAWRLADVGVEQVFDLGVCTFDAPDQYFSFRASQRRSESDYGRNLSAIALA